MFKAATNY